LPELIATLLSFASPSVTGRSFILQTDAESS
jgi:hypothetical protein